MRFENRAGRCQPIARGFKRRAGSRGGGLARGAVRVGRTVGEVLEALVLNLELERVHEELGVILRARWAAVGGTGRRGQRGVPRDGKGQIELVCVEGPRGGSGSARRSTRRGERGKTRTSTCTEVTLMALISSVLGCPSPRARAAKASCVPPEVVARAPCRARGGVSASSRAGVAARASGRRRPKTDSVEKTARREISDVRREVTRTSPPEPLRRVPGAVAFFIGFEITNHIFSGIEAVRIFSSSTDTGAPVSPTRASPPHPPRGRSHPRPRRPQRPQRPRRPRRPRHHRTLT